MCCVRVVVFLVSHYSSCVKFMVIYFMYFLLYSPAVPVIGL